MNLLYAFHILPAPYNRILLVTTGTQLVALYLADRTENDSTLLARMHKKFCFAHLQESVAETTWCAETLERGDTPPLLLFGTPFQKKIWHALQEVPRGTTTTYQQLATAINHPAAVRAVGNAVGANPITIVIPCHRAVRTDGSLGGFYWGQEVKK